VLLMHGEPSWSFLYRKVIPVLVAAGHRCVAPDLVGFGRSDKPIHRDDHTYQRHVDWMSGWLVANDLTEITLLCQDWGGLIGLRLVALHPDRFARVVTANTFLPTGDEPPRDAFLAWREYSQTTPNFRPGRIVDGGCTTSLAPDVVAAYDAPFPDEASLAGARQFPTLVPISPDDPAHDANVHAWEVLRGWTKPWLTAFSDEDKVTRGSELVFQREIPGAAGMPHVTIEGGGHFLQEDRGPELAAAVIAFIAETPPPATPA